MKYSVPLTSRLPVKVGVILTGIAVLSLFVAAPLRRAFREREESARQPRYRLGWSEAAAASYLDQREDWWQRWPIAQKDHGTVCISCHTVVPYALARRSLRRRPEQPRMTAVEQKMLQSIEERVGEWNTMVPFYSDAQDGPGKSAESRATEAVLNAVILASYDSTDSDLNASTRKAFREAWDLQESLGPDAGGWKWQDFHLAPWETPDSAYEGAALFAIGLASAPQRYMESPADQKHLTQLRAYLKAQFSSQPLLGKLYAVWASASMPEIVGKDERDRLLDRVRSLQRSDGGWTLYSLDEGVSSQTIGKAAESDGCSTAIVVLAMESSGADSDERALQQGLDWLRRHQREDGSWYAASLNARRNPESDIGKFMSDAATGYAVLALEARETDALQQIAPSNQKAARERPSVIIKRD